MKRLALAALFVSAVAVCLPTELKAQITGDTIKLGGEEATVVESTDGKMLLRTRNETVVPSRGPGYSPDVNLHWYVVQDSSLGVVFREPSGLKNSGEGDWDGDIDVRFLRPVAVFELTALTFNAWEEHVGTFRMTRRIGAESDDEEGFDPRWYDFDNETGRHLMSLVFISRVRFEDGDIRTAPLEPIEQFVQGIDPSFKSEGLSDEYPRDLMKLWREFLRSLRQSESLPMERQAVAPKR